jgi:alpha-D-ribose 1-methylphosphonate 5-phosphate C-P lyase
MTYEELNGTKPVCKCLGCNKFFSIEEIVIDDRGHKTTPCCNTNYFIIKPSRMELFFDRYLDVNKDPKYYEY